MKTCNHCKIPKETTEFHKNAVRHDGLQGSCKVCLATRRKKVGPDGLTSRQRYLKEVGPDGLTNRQRERLSPEKLREYRYGITTEQFNALLSSQGSACAICLDMDKKLYIDHDHATGKVRSLLCNCCNSALGKLGDSAKIATAAAAYLTKHGNL